MSRQNSTTQTMTSPAAAVSASARRKSFSRKGSDEKQTEAVLPSSQYNPSRHRQDSHSISTVPP